MRLLLIGGNSYLAQAFERQCGERFEITALRRGPGLPSYFDLEARAFEGVDAVVNFAAIVHRKTPDPAEAERINAQLPAYLAHLAKEAGVKQFVQISTVAVYGEKSMIDDTTPPRPENLYGRTKLAGDEGVQVLEEEAFAVAILRPTVVYGPGAPGNMGSLLKLIRTGLPLPLGYDGNRRAILYVGNLAAALERVIAGRDRGVFLLRDAQMPSLRQMCRALAEGAGCKARLFAPPRWLVKLLLRFGPAAFHKLYADFLIDDRYSVERLGSYAGIAAEDALRAMAAEVWL